MYWNEKNCDRARRAAGHSIACFVLAVCVLAGCGNPPPVRVAGDSDEAATVLEDVLKEWKDGKKAADLKDSDPSMIVRDEDWEAGAVLKSYTVNKSPREEGGGWRVEATITVLGTGLPTSPHLAAYTVTLEPVITVMRMDHLE